MTYGWAALWHLTPHLVLCLALLLVLWRQTESHKQAIAKLEALEQALDALGGGEDDARYPSAPCRPQHDTVPQAEAKARSRLRSLDAVLRRR